jgi:hypothetical protein
MALSLLWNKIDWKALEEITLELIKSEIPSVDFSLYLKQGNDQKGIDIKSSVLDNGRIVCAQIKDVQKLTVAQLKDILGTFLKKDFAPITSKFILSTTADLQTEKLQTYLHQASLDLRKDHNISFWYWDINTLEQKLKSRYSLVQKFFGQQAADEHCYHQARPLAIPVRNPVAGFLDRTVRPFKEPEDYNGFFFRSSRLADESKNLVGLFDGAYRGQARQIFLVGDAHQGKTVLLNQTAYDLEHLSNPFVTLLLELKDQPSTTIEEMLTTEFGSWKAIPARNLVVIIDGLDEVQTDWFDSAVREIAGFCKRNIYTNVIASCRKNFYYDYRIRETLKDTLAFFELDPLNEFQIQNYLTTRLRGRYAEFMRYIENGQLSTLLLEPFYLMRLIEKFSLPPHQRPQSKFEVIEQVIEESFNHNLDRRLTGGRPAHQLSVSFKEVARSLAFAMQLAGSNALPEEDVQRLFSQEQIELLQHSSVVAKHNKKWAFTNAIFQEHLAASVLSPLPFDKILSLITIGQKRKKFRTRWLGTVGALLYLMDNEQFKEQLIQQIEDDNIELLVRTEHSRFSSRLKLSIIERLLERSRKYDLQPQIVDDGTIASFVQSAPKVTDLFIGSLNDKSGLDSVKITAARVLKRTTIDPGQGKRILAAVDAELSTCTNPYCINQMLELLATHALGDKEFVQKLIGCSHLNEDHNFRDGVYQLIIAKDCVDEFLPYFLEGLPMLVKHNAEITIGGSELSFEEGVSRITTKRNLELFLKAAAGEDFLNFYEYSSAKSTVLGRVFENAAKIFEKNPLIVLSVIDFVRALGRNFMRREYQEVDLFFDALESGWWVGRMVVREILFEHSMELGVLVTEESIPYLLFEFEELGAHHSALAAIYHSLQYRGKKELAAYFLTEANAACGGNIFASSCPETDRKIWEFEAQKEENDLRIIQSPEALRQGLIDFFGAYGDEAIPEDALYVDWNGSEIRKKLDSNYLYELLLGWSRTDKKIYLKDVLKVADDPQRFERFQMGIINYHRRRTEKEEAILKSIAQRFYEEGIKTARFENCITETVEANGQFRERVLWKEQQLGKLYEKYGFPTPINVVMQMVWLDRETGVYGLEPSYGSEKKKLTKLILENLGDKGEFGEFILNNIRRGINSSRVLATHIGICKNLKLYAVCPFLLELLKEGNRVALSRTAIANIYLELGGSTEQLLDIFETMTDYNARDYLEFVSKLIDHHRSEVKVSLERCFHDARVDESIKTTAAIYLGALGSEEAFKYVAHLLVRGKLDIDRFPRTINVPAVDTRFALDELKESIPLLLQPGSGRTRFSESPGSILFDWLFKFAQKSEADLELVEQLLLEKEQEFRGIYANHRLLFWYASRVVEGFRNSAIETRSISEIKVILRTIDEPALG